VSRGDYGLRDFTQERRRTGSNLLIVINGFLEGEVHPFTGYTGLRLNTPERGEALNPATFESKADTEKHAGN
jgi:hypothetical protein